MRLDRKQLYAEIKKYNVAPLIRKERGNYTNLSNEALYDYIQIVKADLNKAKTVQKNTVPTVDAEEVKKLKEAFVALVNQLNSYHIVSTSNANKILSYLK